MVQVSKGVFRQDYFAVNFFTLLDVKDDEVIRLGRLSVDVVDYDVSIGVEQEEVIFFLHL